MDDKVEEINTDEVSLVETEGPKRRPGSFLSELPILQTRNNNARNCISSIFMNLN